MRKRCKPDWHIARIHHISTFRIVAAKKTFVLRLDEDVYKALERWAADEFRSVNGQIEWMIDASLKKAGRKKEPKEKEGNKEVNE
jgi:hypothetical protein